MAFCQGFSCHGFDDLSRLSGDLTKFSVMEQGLRLNDQGAGEAMIQPEWNGSFKNFTVEAKLEFSPSASNAFGLVFHFNGDSTQQPGAWMLHLGSSGTDDRITWHEWTDGQKGPPLDTADWVHGDQPVTVISWKVTFEDDTIKLFSREKRGLRWRPEGEFRAGPYKGPPDSIGIWMKYSTTRKDKVQLFEWCAGVEDIDHRTVEIWESPAPGLCRIYFGKPVNLSADFSIRLLPGEIPPVGLVTDSLEFGMLEAEWDVLALDVRNGPVVISGLRDEQMNDLNMDSIPVYWFIAGQADARAIITEIMPDPEPSRGWPLSEYVEIHNFGPDTLFADQWTLRDARSEAGIPAFRMAPREFLLLVPETAFPEWSRLGISCVGIGSWPGLNNAEDEVVLVNEKGITVDSIKYVLDEIEPAENRGGGFSIFRPADPCQRTGTWIFSQEASGASPGQDGIRGLHCPGDGPQIEWSGNRLLLNWSRFPEVIPRITEVEISGKALLRSLTAIPGDPGSWILEWGDTPDPQDPLLLYFQRDLLDSCGQILWSADSPLWLTRGMAPLPGELVINEVMMEPSNADRFIELYNAGKRSIRTDELLLYFPERNAWLALGDHGPLHPGQYLALTSSPCLVSEFYRAHDSARIAFVDLDITWSLQDTTVIELVRTDGVNWEMIDRAAYHPDWHRSSLNSKKDVSLERQSPKQSGILSSNWSSSLAPGGGTPGWQNSQTGLTQSSKGKFALEGAIDPDRPDTHWELRWSLPEGDWEMMVELFTLEGKYLGVILAPGPVVPTGSTTWSLEEIRRLSNAPGAHLVSVTCWSGRGKHIRRTLYGLVYPQ